MGRGLEDVGVDCFEGSKKRPKESEEEASSGGVIVSISTVRMESGWEV